MKIHYLGTAAAEGVPAIFCNCEVCKQARLLGGRNIRTRAQVLLDGDFSIDFPPDAYHHALANRMDFSAVKYLFVTHSHMDHFYANDFVLRGGVYAHEMTSSTLDIFANQEVLDVFHESTRRELHDEIAKSIHLHPIKAFEELKCGDYTVHTLQAFHSSKEPLIFLIEKAGKRILHLHDTGRLPESTMKYLERLGGAPVDLISFDCTFLYGTTHPEARHMGLYENMHTFERLKEIGLADGHTVKVITHFSHNNAPTAENLARAEREFGVIAAYDGMEIEI